MVDVEETIKVRELMEKKRKREAYSNTLERMSIISLLTDDELRESALEAGIISKDYSKELNTTINSMSDSEYSFLNETFLYREEKTFNETGKTDVTFEIQAPSMEDDLPEMKMNYPFFTKIAENILPKITAYIRAVTEDVEQILPDARNVKINISAFDDTFFIGDENEKTRLTELPRKNDDFKELFFADEEKRISDSVPIGIAENYQEKAEAKNDEIIEAKQTIEQIYHYSEHYSDLGEGQIAINLKVYGVTVPEPEEVFELLKEKGYEFQDEPEEMEGRIEKLAQSELNNMIFALEDTPNTESFLGMDGRMGGYAIFKIDNLDTSALNRAEDIESDPYTLSDFLREENIDYLSEKTINKRELEKFEKWIRELHEKVKGKDFITPELIVERLIENMEARTPEELQKQKEEFEHQAQREFTEKRKATGVFEITSGDAFIVHWGDNAPPEGELGMHYIQIDETEFESKKLTEKEILENLNDGGFGVQKITGATNLSINEKIEVTIKYKDNGEVRKYTENENRCEGATIVLGGDNSEIMDDIKESGYKPQAKKKNGIKGGRP